MTSDNYPLNLLNDIAGTAWGYPFPADFNQSLEYVLAGLPARERSYIRQRYEYRKTYEEIGRGSGVTRERARQVISKTLRKLNRPERKEFLIYGVSGMINRAAADMRDKEPRKPMLPLYTPLEKLPISGRL
ncbi:MAG: sigma factor-like helix-turn-helix DNA-binding protein, partial [Oscillospiraceae bacterium]